MLETLGPRDHVRLAEVIEFGNHRPDSTYLETNPRDESEFARRSLMYSTGRARLIAKGG